MLDETMTYSCAVFERAGRAARRRAAAQAPTRSATSSSSARTTTCSRSAAAGAASRSSPRGEYGCRVTGLTISRRAGGARARARRDAGLDDRSRSVEQDYRAHRGHATRRSRRSRCSRRSASGSSAPTSRRSTACSRPAGVACVQTILIPDDRWDRYRADAGLDRALRLPGLPDPVARRARRGAATRSRARRSTSVDEIGPHYAETLRRWRANFHARIDEVRALGYDERFERTWDFYLAFCEAGFRTRALRDVQLTLAAATRDERRTHAARADPASAPGPAALPRRGRRRRAHPAAGRCILVANHESLIDPWVPRRSSTPRHDPLHGEGGALALPAGRARSSSAFGALPGRARHRRRDGDRGRGELLARGEVLGIFPQGTSKPVRSRPWHRGAARLALATGAPIVPVRHDRHRAACRRPGRPPGRDRRRRADRGRRPPGRPSPRRRS